MIGLNLVRRSCLNSTRQFSSLSKAPSTNLTSPLKGLSPISHNSALNSTALNTVQYPSVTGGIFSSIMGLMQVRFKTRGNTYQPSTLKRKRTFGFLARLRTKGGQKILARRKTKGRWYMSH